MTNATPGLRDRAAAKWANMKPMLTGLVIGLIAGPIISGFVGFQVRSSSANAATRTSVIEQQAQFCSERARASITGAVPTDWQARNDLARRFAAMPGSTAVDQEVVYACSGKLSG
jgi:hypothetical protein